MDKYLEISSRREMESLIQEIERRIENLKIQFNLFFSGELDIPPDKEREELEKLVRRVQYTGLKSPKINLLLQNAASRFSLYNNMWLKKLNEIETGVVTIKRRKTVPAGTPEQLQREEQVFNLSLNQEESFENLYEKFCKLTPKTQQPEKEEFINSIKSRMISANLVDAKGFLSIMNGKPKIKLTE